VRLTVPVGEVKTVGYARHLAWIECALSSISMSRRLLIALAIAALVAANLLFDIGLVCAGMSVRFVPARLINVLRHISLPIFVSQVLLLGFWLAVGDGKSYVRWLVAVASSAAIALTERWTPAFSHPLRRAQDATDTAAVSLMLCLLFFEVLLAVYVLLFPLRQVGNWRLTWQPDRESRVVRQVRIFDLLLWMVPIGALLATLRVDLWLGKQLFSAHGLAWWRYWQLAGLCPLVFASMLTAFATRRRWLSLLGLVSLTLLLATAFAIVERYRLEQHFRSMVAAGARRPAAAVASHVLWGSFGEWLAYCIATVVAYLNWTALRVLGCRLVRPGLQTNGPHGAS
jgi:hypothetical protein